MNLPLIISNICKRLDDWQDATDEEREVIEKEMYRTFEDLQEKGIANTVMDAVRKRREEW